MPVLLTTLLGSIIVLFISLQLNELNNLLTPDSTQYSGRRMAEVQAYQNPFDTLAQVLGDSTTSPAPIQKSTTGANTRFNSQKFLEDAKKILGCDSSVSCRALCEKPENRQKCAEFSKQEGLGSLTGGASTADCTNPANAERCRVMGAMCGNFCQMNPSLCKAGPINPSTRPFPAEQPQPRFSSTLERLRSATGCQTSEECSTYCHNNPTVCQKLFTSFAEGAGTTVPQSTPNSQQ